MMDNKFEQVFGEYLDSTEYEEIADTMFAATRNAFLAGWKAAGGSQPLPAHIFEVFGKQELSTRAETQEALAEHKK